MFLLPTCEIEKKTFDVFSFFFIQILNDYLITNVLVLHQLIMVIITYKKIVQV